MPDIIHYVLPHHTTFCVATELVLNYEMITLEAIRPIFYPNLLLYLYLAGSTNPLRASRPATSASMHSMGLTGYVPLNVISNASYNLFCIFRPTLKQWKHFCSICTRYILSNEPKEKTIVHKCRPGEGYLYHMYMEMSPYVQNKIITRDT